MLHGFIYTDIVNILLEMMELYFWKHNCIINISTLKILHIDRVH